MKKVLGFALVAALAPAIGCGGAEGELEQVQAQEQLGSQEQALTHRLTATPANVEILRFGCYDENSPPRLRWDCLAAEKTRDGSHLNTQYEFYRSSSGKLDADIYYFVRVNG